MILVDEARYPYRGKLYCHMMSDLADPHEALAELHAFAQQIGLKRSWYQEHSSPHYDLSPRYRALAVQAGAEAVTSRELVRRCIWIHGAKRVLLREERDE
jgi:hypothetical protein